MKTYKRLSALLLTLTMVFALAACGGSGGKPADPSPAAPSQSAEPSPAPAGTPAPAPTPSEAPADAVPGAPARFAVLSGPTGIGAAKLLDGVDNDPAALNTSYEYSIAADNTELVAGLTNGTLDIATMASNAAVNLYNKTGGGVKIIALGTLGVLHILESGGRTSISSMESLRDHTIYCAGQGANPEYVLRYLLTENGIDPDNDVNLVFADASEITQKLMTGDADCAMLPVPAATAAVIKSEGQVRMALDLTKEWEKLDNGSQLIMTAVVARTEFLEAHPEQVDAFLKDYAASIDYVVNNVDEAAELVAGLGITPNAPIAKNAIPQCHLTYIAGKDMAPAISGYYAILCKADPASVGGSLPDDGIYYVP